MCECSRTHTYTLVTPFLSNAKSARVRAHMWVFSIVLQRVIFILNSVIFRAFGWKCLVMCMYLHSDLPTYKNSMCLCMLVIDILFVLTVRMRFQPGRASDMAGTKVPNVNEYFTAISHWCTIHVDKAYKEPHTAGHVPATLTHCFQWKTVDVVWEVFIIVFFGTAFHIFSARQYHMTYFNLLHFQFKFDLGSVQGVLG